jgi:uncharacterized protein
MAIDGKDKTHRVLLLPGWMNSGDGHWQTRWEQAHGFRRVEQADWVWPRRGDWMTCLEEALLAEPRPAVLAAHSLGCHLVAAWAAHSKHTHRVRGALLVAPPDLDRADMPPQVTTWRPVLRRHLPFPTVLAHSDDDPYCSAAAAEQLAAEWGSSAWLLPGRGHVNAESGLGDWPDGLQRLRQLASEAA